MAETFGCCSSYVQCSDAGMCLHASEEDYSGCQYRLNLEAGHIFYGRNAGKQVPQFHITVKGKNWWSYSASPAQKEAVYDVLSQAGILKVPDVDGYCGSRVLLDVGSRTYALYAPGPRMMPEDAARAIQEKVERFGHVEVEIMSVGRKKPKKDIAQSQARGIEKPEYKQMNIFELGLCKR